MRRGYLQVTDRLKDVIKTGGEWISSLTLEDIISRHPAVSEAAVIGDRVIIHSGTVIGSDGFGYFPVNGAHMKIPQMGNVVIEDDVEIGACVTIDRARFDKTLGIELYLEAGIRGVEIGAILADRDPVTRENRYPDLELLRLAIPRRTYTNNHMAVVAAALKNVFDRRESMTHGYKINFELPIMRHFTVKLDVVK